MNMNDVTCSYINRNDIDFDNIESMKPTQEWELARQDVDDHIEYPTRYLTVMDDPRMKCRMKLRILVELRVCVEDKVEGDRFKDRVEVLS